MSASSNITAGFIDLATFDELEKYSYGGQDATTYFVREVRKSTWFSIVPVVLAKSTGLAGFGQEMSVSISRAGDYLLHTWLRVQFPALALNSTLTGGGLKLRWTRNLMHNLIKTCSLSFNDLSAAQFDNYHLDFWSAFTTPAGKSNGYKNMILDVPDMIDGANATLPEATGNLPLPFFFSRDSGVALPTAALPYNDGRIHFTFREWTDLLIVDNPTGSTVSSLAAYSSRRAVEADLTTLPAIRRADVWATYAIVTADERKRMGCAPRNILIEQSQTAPVLDFNPLAPAQSDIRFSHAIKVFFFGVRNTTVPSSWSNYTTSAPVPGGGSGVDHTPNNSADPIADMTLVYENTHRLSAMGADYYSLVNPWYHAPVIPNETGYHMYSYSLDFICLDPKGSTNYGKLTNVSVRATPSTQAIASATTAPSYLDGYPALAKYQYVQTAVNNTIIRIAGGTFGFPVL